MLTINRWQQVKELFHSALEREPAERGVYLASACNGDDSLREEVLSLLASHEQRGSFLDAPAYEAAAELLAMEELEVMTGRLVGHYRIVSLLGRGGMGEIYLAEDTKLDRKVALKLLPVEWTEDADRLSRFRREARAASALNHPNILTIYEIGESDGLHFIATEFIEGQTLRERMQSGLELDDVLDVSIQIASALQAAHEAGIVHRDIKPENIMLRRDRIVKVLDFGLVKLVEQPRGVNLEGSTKLLSNTHPGIVMGTVQYMSPEQARGLAVDARTDIWSVGCVLYEMIAGRAPFEGPTMTDVLAAIIEREPPGFSSIRTDAPVQLEWIIRKSLRKERDERFQTARELLVDLKRLREELEFEAKLEASVAPDSNPSVHVSTERSDQFTKGSQPGKSAPLETKTIAAVDTNASVEIGAGTIKKRRRLALALACVLALVASAAIAASAYRFLWVKKSAPPFDKINITQLTSSRNVIYSAISPDGNYLVYSISDREQHSLWLRQVSASNDTLIVPPSYARIWGITFSRDGKELYYILRSRDEGASTLYRMPVLGGASVKVLDDIDSAVSFSPDGRHLAFVRGAFPSREESALIIADRDGGSERVLAVRRRPERFYPIYFTGPSWSPDGEWIACAVYISAPYGGFSAFNVKDGSEKRLSQAGFTQLGRIEWLRDMSGLVFIGSDLLTPSLPGQVWFVSYPGGELRRITNDLINYRGLSMTADATRLVTSSVSEVANLWSAPEGDAARARQIAPIRSRGGLAFTPDGRVVYSTETGGVWDIWIMNADGTNRKQLTGGAGQNIEPAVSPDGRYIVFTSTRASTVDLWRINMDGGNPVQLTKGMYGVNASFTPDGRYVVFTSGARGPQRIWKIAVDGGSPTGIFEKASYRPVVSPDGRWVAVFYSDSPNPSNDLFRKIAIFPFEGGEPVKVFEYTGNPTTRDVLQWTRDGSALLYNQMNDNVSNIWKQPVDGGPPQKITDFKESLINDFAYSRDGRLLLCTRATVIREAVMITDLR
ncbi:MAG TPA: protein kinase [Pyrinomonadaceae bacterium]|jgi:serine/threonine protein kinase/dipeptidyl aminopeptidase/acylaminoacyl peptidase